MTIADGLEQRTAETDAHTQSVEERDEILASDAKDLSGDFAEIYESMDALRTSIIALRHERDALKDALKDLAFGAELLMQVPELINDWPKSVRDFVSEVRRVALGATL